jgi:hypothetical protein
MNSFLQGKKTISAASLTRPANAALARVPSAKQPKRPGQSAPEAAQVEVVKEGDKVVRIIVTCVCGERVEVECLYPVGS